MYFMLGFNRPTYICIFVIVMHNSTDRLHDE